MQGWINKVERQWWSEHIWLSNTEDVIWALTISVGDNLLSLLEKKEHWTIMRFKHAIESLEEAQEIILLLKKRWFKNIVIAKPDWKIIDNLGQTIWLDTFIFSDDIAEYLSLKLAKYHKAEANILN